MIGIVLALGIFWGGALGCLAAMGRPRWARVMGPAVTVVGSLVGVVPAMVVLGGGSVPAWRLPWAMPFSSLAMTMDAISAWFALPILVISALAAVYGVEYLKPYEGKKDTAVTWFFFNLLAGSMLLVVVARNAMLFLLAWEVMSLSSFFLVMFESEKESVRRAGWTYLVATHIGTAFLLVLFALMGRHGGGLDFDQFAVPAGASGMASVAFLLAVVGFGTKAGFMPLHVWLPEAHPAAPSHVSAVMSGVMIKTGIYGIVRMLTFLGAPPPWWGWLLIGIGVVSGVLGILFALAQHDLKRLLAYSSVENIGIVAIGLGVGLLGMSYGNAVMAFLGLAGALLHVVHHAVFKSLLFLGAGSVLHGAGTREIDRLGGLLKRLPSTGLVFLVGAVAICGLPPLNGFVGEFLIYVGSFEALAVAGLPGGALIAGLMVAGSLALIGGLAAACFAKAFGTVFLGEPRGPQAEHAHESGRAMRVPMIILATLCVVLGLAGPVMVPLLKPVAGIVLGDLPGVPESMSRVADSLWLITGVAAGIFGLTALLALIRHRILAGRSVTGTVTWDCGYVAPTPRMQYTASSFADPIVRLFHLVLRTHQRFTPPTGLFPVSSSFSSETPDVYRERMYRPVFSMVESVLARFRWMQHGLLNLYILCLVLALVILLVWKLG